MEITRAHTSNDFKLSRSTNKITMWFRAHHFQTIYHHHYYISGIFFVARPRTLEWRKKRAEKIFSFVIYRGGPWAILAATTIFYVGCVFRDRAETCIYIKHDIKRAPSATILWVEMLSGGARAGAERERERASFVHCRVIFSFSTRVLQERECCVCERKIFLVGWYWKNKNTALLSVSRSFSLESVGNRQELSKAKGK
jgi:hypothetical protein